VSNVRAIARAAPWILPWILGVAVFLIAPLGLSAYTSVMDHSLLDKPVYVGLSNYRQLLSDPLAGRAAWNTVVYTCLSVTLGTALSLSVAALLGQGMRLSGLTRAVVFVPTLVPVVAAGLAWSWMLNTQNGPVNLLLGFLGVPAAARPDWLGSVGWAMGSVVMVSLWTVGSFVVIYSAAMRGVPASLYEAAMIDGAGPVRRFVSVTLPMISPAIAFNTVMSVIWSLQAFAVPLVMTRGGPEDSTLTFGMHVYNSAFVFGRMGYASALAWVQFAVTLAFVLVGLRLSRGLVHSREGV